MTSRGAAPVCARTTALEHPVVLTELLGQPQTSAWIRGGAGLIGWGAHAILRHRGADTFTVAQRWFTEQVAALDVVDEVRQPGTGPVAFLSAAFDPKRGESVFVIPQVVIGSAGPATRAWCTTVGTEVPELSPSGLYAPVTTDGVAAGAVPATGYRNAVASAVARIGAGHLDKVVLARDVRVHAKTAIDERALVARLAASYPDCWAFAVDGMVGATPELLARVTHGRVYTRILAGTEWGEGAAERITSAKNREEHDYAARSAAAALEKVTVRLEVPTGPHVLQLPNLMHLATEITGEVAPAVHPLDVAAVMHPTAAVGGTPTEAALTVIDELEPAGRGRYAGPVGWFDANGNCEFGIALRSAQLSADRREAHLYAGCGIVAGSDPDTELAESARKFGVMLDALGATLPVE